MPAFKRSPRFNISIDILLILLFATRFFDMNPMAWLFRDEGQFFSYILLLIVIYIRNMGFSVRYSSLSKMRPVWLMLAGVLISFIPAYRYYGQHLYYSFIVYRHFLGYFALFVLLSIKPSHRELKRGLNAFTFLYLFFTLFVTFVNPRLVTVEDNKMFMGEGDLVHMLPGVEYVVLAFIYAVDDLRRQVKFSWPHLALAGLVFLVVFLAQNRTTLLATMVIVILAVFSNRSARKRLTAEVIMSVFAILLVLLASGYILGLVEETVTQLSDPDYNRVKAFTYFTSAENGLMSIFWGNGFISGLVHPIVSQLNQEGIYYSDMGMLGFWYQFGLIPVIVILGYVLKGLSGKHSFVVRANALFILVGIFSISYFLRFQYSIWLCIFLYLESNDEQYEIAVAEAKVIQAKKAIKRYRSLI